MTFYIHVRSGLNNKLVPLLSLLRISRKENKIIRCYWGIDAYMNKCLFLFTDLFKNIDDIEFISIQEYNKQFYNSNNKIYNKLGSDRDRNEIIYKKDNNISVFNKIVHLISYNDDNIIGDYVPYPRITKEPTEFIQELREVIKDLKPIDEIQDKINNVTKHFNEKNVVGLHIRTTDGGFIDIPSNDIFLFIQQLINKNKDIKIYISCDNLSLENEIISKFPNIIIYFLNPFGNNYSDKFNRNSYGTINAVCEMFILSKCNRFYGTPGSSFSFMVWLLRNDHLLEFWCDNPWN